MLSRKLLLGILLFPFIVSAQKQTLFTKSEFENQNSCYRIPSIIKTQKGTLIAAVDERVGSCADLIGGKNINIAIRTSKDGGKTWSENRRIIDFPDGQSASDVSMVQDKKTKEIFLFYNYMDLINAPNEFYFQYVSSNDDGKTWSTPRDITKDVALPEWQKTFKFITSGRAEYTREGWILNTIVHLEKGVYVFGSKDHGKTWERWETLAPSADETNIVELPNKNWMLNARVTNHGHRKIFISKDKGKTWNVRTEEQLEDPTCNASTLVHNKTIYFSNLHVKGSNARKNLGLKKSTDNGITWEFVKTIESGDAAYSVLTPISKKKIGILYEQNNYRDIVFEVIDL